MRVAFTYHAAERVNQRLGANIKEGMEVDLGNLFVKVRTYQHRITNEMVSDYAHRDPKQPCVMVISKTGVVLTVMTQGYDVDATYAELARKQ